MSHQITFTVTTDLGEGYDEETVREALDAAMDDLVETLQDSFRVECTEGGYTLIDVEGAK